jgi:hypothetical protein
MTTPDEFNTHPDNASFSPDHRRCAPNSPGTWPVDPSSTKGALLPVSATSGWPHRADEPRREAHDLDVISAQWTELPPSPSPLRRLFIALVDANLFERNSLFEQKHVEVEDEQRRLADPFSPPSAAPSSRQRQPRGKKERGRGQPMAQKRQQGDKGIWLADPSSGQRQPRGTNPRRRAGEPRQRRGQPMAQKRRQQRGNEATWPTDPCRMPTAPLFTAPTSGWQGKQDWRDDEQRREMRARRAALRRQEADLQSHLQRLEAQESALAAQWAALPSPSSPVKRLFIALLVVSGLVVLLHWFPLLLVLVIVAGLAMAKAAHRSARFSRQHTVWLQQERARLESRRRGIVAEQAVIRQHLAALQSELHQPLP